MSPVRAGRRSGRLPTFISESGPGRRPTCTSTRCRCFRLAPSSHPQARRPRRCRRLQPFRRLRRSVGSRSRLTRALLPPVRCRCRRRTTRANRLQPPTAAVRLRWPIRSQRPLRMLLSGAAPSMSAAQPPPRLGFRPRGRRWRRASARRRPRRCRRRRRLRRARRRRQQPPRTSHPGRRVRLRLRLRLQMRLHARIRHPARPQGLHRPRRPRCSPGARVLSSALRLTCAPPSLAVTCHVSHLVSWSTVSWSTVSWSTVWWRTVAWRVQCRRREAGPTTFAATFPATAIPSCRRSRRAPPRAPMTHPCPSGIRWGSPYSRSRSPSL